MTDYFKTVRAYLRGKWGRKSSVTDGLVNAVSEVGAINYEKWRRVGELLAEIARLKRAKKKHSHLQKQLDDLMNGRANIQP